MNTIVTQLMDLANSDVPQSGTTTNLSLDDRQRKVYKAFAERLVIECIETVQRKIIRNGNTPENLRSYQHVKDLASTFGIELPIKCYNNIERETLPSTTVSEDT